MLRLVAAGVRLWHGHETGGRPVLRLVAAGVSPAAITAVGVPENTNGALEEDAVMAIGTG